MKSPEHYIHILIIQPNWPIKIGPLETCSRTLQELLQSSPTHLTTPVHGTYGFLEPNLRIDPNFQYAVPIC